MDEHKHNEIQMTQLYVKADVLGKYFDDPEIVEMIERDIGVNLNALLADSSNEVPLCRPSDNLSYKTLAAQFSACGHRNGWRYDRRGRGAAGNFLVE